MFLQRIFQSFQTLNLFDSKSSDPTIVHREKLSTRLFLFLFLVLTIILLMYTSFSVRIKSETIQKPIQSIYENLQKHHGDTLKCSCEKISIPFGKFVNIIPSFHQVCSSDFVSQNWIDFTFEINQTSMWPIDIRRSLSSLWQLISILCLNSINTTNNALEQFNNFPLISSMILSEEFLKGKMEATLDELRQTASATLTRPLTLVHRIVQANEFITALSTNYILVTEQFRLNDIFGHINDISFYLGIFAIRYRLNESTTYCSCRNNGSCPIPAKLYLYNQLEKYGIYDLTTIEANETIQGIIIDCFPLKTTLASSLDCFYNKSCVNLILSSYEKSIDISILNSTKLSRFLLTTTIESLVNELFIEQLDIQLFFNKYYFECSPIYCHYTYSHRFDWIYVLTTLLALLGGLNTALRLITPYLINICFMLKYRKSVQNPTERQSIQVYLSNLIQKLKQILFEFNLFSKQSQDLNRIKHGRNATRLYILFLTISFCILIVYTSISIQTISQTIEYPTEEQYKYLFQEYNQTLQCPCSTITISYEEFIEINPIYHQICTSDFVQSSFYGSFSVRNQTESQLDFVASVSSYFQALSMLCESANLTVINAIRLFSSTSFVNAQILPSNLFYLQTNTLITTFRKMTQADFFQTMSLIDAVLQANQYVSSTLRNSMLRKDYFPEYEQTDLGPIRISASSMAVEYDNGELCYCVLNSSCKIYNRIILDGITHNLYSELAGIYADCSIVNSVLRSSLICWYNNSCIETFRIVLKQSGIDNIQYPNSLNSNLPTLFSSNIPTRTIFNEIMIEQWNFSISYEKFYKKCRPISCTYTYTRRSDIIYIITTIIGLFGGLNIVFRTISPLITSLILRCIRRKNNSLQNSSIIQTHSIDFNRFNEIRLKLSTLNLFDSESTEENTIKFERISTKLYIPLLLICLCCVTIYTCLSKEIFNIQISKPSQNIYEQLLLSHSKTLQCPCEQISVSYKEFIQIQTSFHQVCSSDFVKFLWQICLFTDGDWYYRERTDIRQRGAAYFVFLQILCDLSQTIINNANQEFLIDNFVNNQMISQQDFRFQIEANFNQFKIITFQKFANSLKLISQITNGNAFISSYSLNWFWSLKLNSSVATIPIQSVQLSNGCSCGTRTDCLENGGFYYSFSNILEYSIPGWNIACSSVETLFQSTLECFYNQTCVDFILYYSLRDFFDDFHTFVNISSMNSTIESRFKTNTLIQQIINEVFIEQWNINISYELFYNNSFVNYCSYTIEQTNNFIYILTKILGLYGGLTVTLRFLVPYIIKLIFKIKNYFNRNTVIPID